MIVIQLVLIFIFLIIGVDFISSRGTSRTRAFKKMLLLLTLPAAIIVVLFPNSSTDVAHFLGVGRGADLLLYGFIVIFIFQMFNNYLKDREANEKVVTLVRKIAILEASKNTVTDKNKQIK